MSDKRPQRCAECTCERGGADCNWIDTRLLTFTYTNWRGETAERRVDPAVRLWFGSSEWHPEEQWFLQAFDMDKREERDFALRDCRFGPAP